MQSTIHRTTGLKKKSRRLLGACALGVALSVGAFAVLSANARPEATSSDISEKEALEIAEQAYVYGYPLVTMEVTRRVMTNAATAGEKHAPMGQFARMRKYPDASFRDVTAPNADTLYTVAWFDLEKEPYVVSVPAMNDRYYLLPMLNAWTEVFQVPGKRTTGGGAQTFAITGPNFKGKLPAGVVEYKSKTNTVWLLGRIYSSGTPADYEKVHALQDQMAAVPLSAYGKPYTPPRAKVDPAVDMKTPVRDQVDKMSAKDYFGTLAAQLAKNPPAPADAPVIAKMAKIGIEPGKELDEQKLAKVIAKWESLKKVKHYAKELAERDGVNGWIVKTDLGNYGTRYLDRAFVTAVGLGANKPEDAVYVPTRVDGDGKPLDGSHAYVIHVPKGQTPPVRGFWSLTMYDDKLFFVENPKNRFTLSQRDTLKTNPDGSVDLYIQKDSPGAAKESNWLPAPDGKFVLMLRLYWPKDSAPSILDGSWKPWPVRRVN